MSWVYYNVFYSSYKYIYYMYIIICYIYIALFWGGGGCSIHLDDDATAAILRQNAHYTPAYWWRDRVMKSINVWRWLGGHHGQRPMGEFGRDAGVTPLLFLKDIMRFLMTTESQDLGSTSHPKDSACETAHSAFYSIVFPSLYWGVRTHTDHRMSTHCWSH